MSASKVRYRPLMFATLTSYWNFHLRELSISIFRFSFFIILFELSIYYKRTTSL